jgi:glycosyltransferase involved in cell wall biosynthesis
MRTMKRIALFQYEWPLQVHTVNLTVQLAESGWHVDLFLCGCDSSYVVISDMGRIENIEVHDLNPYETQSPLRHKIMYAMDRVGIRHKHPPDVFSHVVKESFKHIKKYDYRCFIGIEKKGLIWAGRLAEKVRTPYLYYSLELYLEDHPAFIHDEEFARVRREEIKYHRVSRGTIIQDRMRAEVLLASNGIEQTDLLFLPVSLPEEENSDRSAWLYEQNGIPPGKKIILYFGLIAQDRLSGDMAAISGRLRNDCTMVIHGFGSEDEIGPLRGKENLVLSLDFVEQHGIKNLISSATIGLVMYGDTCSNDRLTAFSSEKLALYLQSGIPIIAFDRGNYRELMDAYPCGELISDMKELPGAVEKILANYERYRAEAFSAYRELYRYDNYFKKIEAYLSAL